MIGNEEHGYAIAVGKYRLTEPEPTQQEASDKLITERYNIIGNMIAAMIDMHKEAEQEELKQKYENMMTNKRQ